MLLSFRVKDICGAAGDHEVVSCGTVPGREVSVLLERQISRQAYDILEVVHRSWDKECSGEKTLNRQRDLKHSSAQCKSFFWRFHTYSMDGWNFNGSLPERFSRRETTAALRPPKNTVDSRVRRWSDYVDRGSNIVLLFLLLENNPIHSYETPLPESRSAYNRCCYRSRSKAESYD